MASKHFGVTGIGATGRGVIDRGVTGRGVTARRVTGIGIGIAALCGLALAAEALAHHSHGNYDLSEWVPLEGTVREVHLINPHSWIYLEVAGDAGAPAIWALEATFPRWLERNGIEPDDVKPGDPVRVRCHRLRDGSNGCLLGYVTPMHGDPERGHGVEKEWD